MTPVQGRDEFDPQAPQREAALFYGLFLRGHPADGLIELKVNGVVRQTSVLSKMIWNVAEQISQLSQAFELMPGDIIYSGTPENVGPVVKGDVIECHIDKLPNLSVKIV